MNYQVNEISINLDTDYDKMVEKQNFAAIKRLEQTYEFHSHLKCSALTGDNIKTIFDEIIMYSLKLKSA